MDLRRAWPGQDALPADLIRECTDRVLTATPPDGLGYIDGHGHRPLREWVAHDTATTVENVLLSNGSLQLLDLLCGVMLSRGDTIVTESPTYDRALQVFVRRGITVVGAPLQPDGLDLDVVRRAITQGGAKAVYVIPDFQNPSGATMSRERRDGLLELAAAHHISIIEDSPYRRLRYAGTPIPALADIDPTHVLSLLSFSKYVAPGLRVGALIAPPAIISQVAHLAEQTYVGPGALAQAILADFLRNGLLEPHLHTLRELYGPRMDRLNRSLARTPLLQAHTAQGGLFASATLPESVDPVRFSAQAARRSLHLIEGHRFYPTQPGHQLPDQARRFIRLPVTVPDNDLSAAVTYIDEILTRVLDTTDGRGGR